MLQKLSVLGAILFAVLILAISIFRMSTPKYAFYVPPSASHEAVFSTDVGYFFPSPGISPDNPLWFAKALRDQVWLFFTFGSQKRARVLLLFGDKRVVMSEDLMRRGKSSLAVATADKAEQYLRESYNEEQKAENEGQDTTDLLTTLSKSSLRHRETLEYETTIAPQDAVPMLIKIIDTPKMIYNDCTQKLIHMGKNAPKAQENSSKKS